MSADQAAAAVLLYVEDEPITQELVETTLKEAGFEVVVASCGAEALRILETNTEPVHGLITDINLGGGPEGWEVARRARELIDAVPVVYVSGGSGHEWSSRGVPRSVMITKPFAPTQIVVAMSTLLVRTDA